MRNTTSKINGSKVGSATTEGRNNRQSDRSEENI